MESQGNMDRPLCDNGCGFYGSLQNRNLCSKCYKDILKEELAKSTAKAVCTEKPLTLIAPLNSPTLKNSTAHQSLTPETVVGPRIITSSCASTRVKHRCNSCNKRVGPLGFACRCGNVFCGRHRYPEEHACNFDFKAVGREVLVKENPVVKGDKMQWRI